MARGLLRSAPSTFGRDACENIRAWKHGRAAAAAGRATVNMPRRSILEKESGGSGIGKSRTSRVDAGRRVGLPAGMTRMLAEPTSIFELLPSAISILWILFATPR